MDGQEAPGELDAAQDLPAVRQGHPGGGLQGVVQHVDQQGAQVRLVHRKLRGHLNLTEKVGILPLRPGGGPLQNGVDGQVVGVDPGSQLLQVLVQLPETGAQPVQIPLLLEQPQRQQLLLPLVAQADGLGVLFQQDLIVLHNALIFALEGLYIGPGGIDSPHQGQGGQAGAHRHHPDL